MVLEFLRTKNVAVQEHAVEFFEPRGGKMISLQKFPVRHAGVEIIKEILDLNRSLLLAGLDSIHNISPRVDSAIVL